MESMINATVTPYSDTTRPPTKAPRQSAVDHVALSNALAVVKSSLFTMLGIAARSAVTYSPCKAIIAPEQRNIHQMSSGPSTAMNAKARKICRIFVAIINFLRFARSASRPKKGCMRAKQPIRTAMRIPSNNSESVYSKMMRKRAMVLNHSPNFEINAAIQNLRYVLFSRTKRK